MLALADIEQGSYFATSGVSSKTCFVSTGVRGKRCVARFGASGGGQCNSGNARGSNTTVEMTD